DRILDNMTLYWVTNTSTSSARLYWESFRTIYAAIASGQKPPELKLPVAFTVFPPPRSCERPSELSGDLDGERCAPTVRAARSPEAAGACAGGTALACARACACARQVGDRATLSA